MRWQFAAAIWLSLGLAACGIDPRPRDGALVPTPVTVPGVHLVPLLIATTREAAPDTPAFYSGERGSDISFSKVTVSIPPAHKEGKIEWPKKVPGDPAKDFVASEARYLDGSGAFLAELDAGLARMPKGERTVGIFVHGYNTTFDESAFRNVQMVKDSGIKAVPVLFTWASRGETTDYIYDRDSATIARDGLEETVRLIQSSKWVDKIVIFAHSMGNWVTMEALRQAAISGHGDFGGKLDQVVLAAPDIDVDVFKAQMRRIGVPKKPYILFVSADDRALAFSSLIAGDKPRLGAFTEDRQALADLGLIIIDVSKLDSHDPANHWKFTATAAALADEAGKRPMAGRPIGDIIARIIKRTEGIIVTLPRWLITGQLTTAAR